MGDGGTYYTIINNKENLRLKVCDENEVRKQSKEAIGWDWPFPVDISKEKTHAKQFQQAFFESIVSSNLHDYWDIQSAGQSATVWNWHRSGSVW